MRHPLQLSIIAVGALGMLAACGNQNPAGSTAGDPAVTADQIAEKRAELERLEADLQAQQQAAAPPVQDTPPAASARPASPQSTARPAPPPAPQTLTAPAGTEVPVALEGALSTKTAKVGQAIQARVTDDVVIEGRTVIPQGLIVAGSVISVVSGSNRIGGTPGLGLAFDRIEMPDGTAVPIAGEFEEKGKSDTTRDAVKIVGGAAAGTLLADQISKRDRNRVIGGIIGAAAGAVAARETGTEVTLDAGTTLTLVLSEPVEIPRR